MEARIQRWGNSLAIRLPAAILKQAELDQDARVNISVDGSRIVLEPIVKYELKDLLARITDDNRHEVVDFGGPVGKEVL